MRAIEHTPNGILYMVKFGLRDKTFPVYDTDIIGMQNFETQNEEDDPWAHDVSPHPHGGVVETITFRRLMVETLIGAVLALPLAAVIKGKEVLDRTVDVLVELDKKLDDGNNS